MKKKKTMAQKILPALIGVTLIVTAFALVMVFLFSWRTKNNIREYSDEMREKNRETIFDKILTENEMQVAINVDRQSRPINHYFLNCSNMLKSICESARTLYETDRTAYADRDTLLSSGSKIKPYYRYSDDYDENDPKTMEIRNRMSELQVTLKEAIALNSDVSAAYFASPCGFMVIADTGEQTSGERDTFDFTSRDWYQKAVEQKDVVFLPTYRDYFTGEKMITLSSPVYSGQELIGVIAMDISSDILDIVLETENTFTTYDSFSDSYNFSGYDVFVMDTAANIVYSSDKNYYLDSMVENGRFPEDRYPSISAIAGSLEEYEFAMAYLTLSKDLSHQVELPEGSEISDFNLDEGRMLLVSYAMIPVANWAYVTIGEPTVMKAGFESEQEYAELSEKHMTRLRDGLFRGLAIILFGFLAVCLVMYFVSRRIAKRLSAPVEKLTEKVRNVEGDNLTIEPDPEDDMEETSILAESFRAMTERVQRYIHDVTSLTAEKERLSAELDVATKIQADMLSQDFPDQREIKLYASMTPAKEVGGDFYDFFRIDEDHMGLVIADVSGKGVPAALFMVKAMTLIKNATLIGGKDPAGILEVVNNALCEGNEEMLFVTVWFSVLTISTGELVCANAGHEFPMLKRKDGRFELLTDEHDIPLAAMPGITFQEYHERMNPGDILFLYTDGFPESINEKTEQFTETRILAALNETESEDPKDLIEHTYGRVKGFVGKADQFDDMTALCILYQNREVSAPEES